MLVEGKETRILDGRVQVSEIVPTGELDPENIVTPGIYVNSIVRVAGVAEKAA